MSVKMFCRTDLRCFSEVRFPPSFTTCHWSLFPFLAKIKWVFVIVYQKNKCIFAQNISSGSDCAANTCCIATEESAKMRVRTAQRLHCFGESRLRTGG